MNDLVHVIDKNFRIMLFNEAFREKHKKLGLDIKVIGQNPFDTYLFLPDRIREEYMAVFRTGEMLVTEEPTKINGKEIIAQTRKIPIHEGERVSLIVTVIRNITEPTKLEEELQEGEKKPKRIKAERALWESEEKYRALAESSEDGICILESTGRILYSNKACGKLFGKKSSTLFGKGIIDIFPRENVDRIFKEIQNVFHKKVITQREHTIQSGRHLQHFAITFAPILDKKKAISLVMTIRNITKQKRMETALKEAYIKSEKERSKVAKALKKKITESKKAYSELQDSKDELVRTERLAFTGRIAAGIAHEIRNPLTNVAMSIRQLMKTLEPEKPRSKHVDIITRNTERINYLITELLNCARPPKLDMQSFDIHKVLKNVLDTVSPKISLRKIKVIRKFTSKPSTIEIDKEQVERAFLNIVINAVEAMSKEGKLNIVTEHNGALFIIKFQDTGRGIAEEDIMKIFDPFFSSKRDGVGLGLSVCYGIIVSHGGTIEVESKWKKGSVFTITLPLKQKSGGGVK